LSIIINQIYTLNPELSNIIVISVFFNAKNPKALKIILIFINEHDKIWTKMSKIRQF